VVRERDQRTGTKEPQGDIVRVPTGRHDGGGRRWFLVGWLFSFDAQERAAGAATMKANTALCFLLAGLALALRQRPVVRWACAGTVFTVAGLTLAQDLTGASFGIDQLLFHDTIDVHTIHPGRMVQATALGFLLAAHAHAARALAYRSLRATSVGRVAGVIGLIAV
jgi:hypothetical protein